MGYLKQVFIEVRYHKNRSVLFSLVIVVLSFFIFAGFYLRNIVNNIYNQLIQEEGYCIDADSAVILDYDAWKNRMDQLSQNPVIEGYSNRTQKYYQTSIRKEDDQGVDVYLTGVIQMKYTEAVRDGTVELAAGRWMEAGDREVVLEETFAEKTGIHLDEQIRIENEEMTVSALVVGVYKKNGALRIDSEHEGYYSESKYPVVYGSYTLYETVSGDRDLHVMSFYADSFDHMDDLTLILKSAFGKDTILINVIENHIRTTGTTIKVFVGVSNALVIGSCGLLLLCITVLSVIWMRAHIPSVRIQIILGEKKSVITAQLVSEIALICEPVALVSTLICTGIFGCFGRKLFDKILRMSGNDMSFWDIGDTDNLNQFDISTIVLPVIVCTLIVILVSGVYGCYIAHKPYRKLKTINA